MIPILIRPSINRAQLNKISKRAANRALKKAFFEVGLLWKRRYLGKHFRSGAATKYKYRRRSQKYVQRKRRLARSGGGVEGGGRLPLVYRGETRRRSRGAQVRGFPTRLRVKVPTPKYIPRRPRGGTGKPNMAREIVTAAQDELVAMKALFQKKVDEEFQREFDKATRGRRRRRR